MASEKIMQRGLTKLSGLIDLLIRLTLFHVFFVSGWYKWIHWSETLKLFKTNYALSFLSANTTAIIGTGAEILFGILLLLGLGSRIAALALLVINFLTTVYYPPLQAEMGHAHLLIHCYWGLLLLVIITHGPGPISLDKWFFRKK